jgi:hypothetical protein
MAHHFFPTRAKVAELVDALDLGSSGATRGSSSLPFRTTGAFRNVFFFVRNAEQQV